MTSTVSGDLQPGIGYYDLFRAIFPCGSITGAPKIRTMQVIRELEGSFRGVAFGSIGYFSPAGDAVFSVAIRTLVLRDREWRMRVGSGITYDSDPEAEYEECLLKANFLSEVPAPFGLIETMLWKQEYFWLDLHLQRLADSAQYFDFAVDMARIRQDLELLSQKFDCREAYRVRLVLDRSGKTEMQPRLLDAAPDVLSLQLACERTDSSDAFLRHKTTRRQLYDRVFAQVHTAGFDDAVFLNEKQQVTECAIQNLLMEKDGQLLTPALECGLLPGVFRQFLLSKCQEVQEEVLSAEELFSADRIFALNSVRGLRPVKEIDGGEVLPGRKWVCRDRNVPRETLEALARFRGAECSTWNMA
jgi:para-aminobenzoate synthetase/4-amino-4-deoxychorismate lyase